MNERVGNQDQPTRRHLLDPAAVRKAATANANDLTRGHGQGNGLRTHGIYFVAVSLVALFLFVALIAFFPVRM